jgi:hypothetical protein
MDSRDRLQLEKMIQANDVQDCTEDIRRKQHSKPIKEDVKRMLALMKSHARLKATNPVQFDTLLVSRCNFLFTYYTDIFNKVKKEELPLDVLWELLGVLGEIERGELDQHTGAFVVGKLLKKMYIDAALRKGEKLDARRKPKPKAKNITWARFKAMQGGA